MKLSDVAAKHGISLQRVYKKIADAKIDVKTLKDSKTGELTADGEAVITQLFNSKFKKVNQPDQHSDSVIQSQKSMIEKLEIQLSSLKDVNALLKAQNEDLKRQIQRLEKDVDHERQISLSLMERLNQGFFARLTSGKKGK